MEMWGVEEAEVAVAASILSGTFKNVNKCLYKV
jgi:hypothetical protein